MSDKEYLTPSELEIEARAKAAINTDYGQSVLITADIPALLSTLRAERAKREELERELDRIKKHEREKWEAIPREFRPGNPKPYEDARDPHTPGPGGPMDKGDGC